MGCKLRKGPRPQHSEIQGDRLEDPTAGSPPPHPITSSLVGEEGLGPMEETAKGLLFHDPLLIRMGLATKSRTHPHKNRGFAKRNSCWLKRARVLESCYGSFFPFYFIFQFVYVCVFFLFISLFFFSFW